jgi:hypothetical protein
MHIVFLIVFLAAPRVRDSVGARVRDSMWYSTGGSSVEDIGDGVGGA